MASTQHMGQYGDQLCVKLLGNYHTLDQFNKTAGTRTRGTEQILFLPTSASHFQTSRQWQASDGGNTWKAKPILDHRHLLPLFHLAAWELLTDVTGSINAH